MKPNKKYTDQQIVEALREGGAVYQEASRYLFHQYLGYIPTILNKLPIDRTQAEDAYADALVKMIRHLKAGQFRKESKLSTYFYKIYYNSAVDVSRKLSSNKVLSTQELHEYSAREEDLMHLIGLKDQAGKITLVIQKMGDTCKSVLMDWAYYGYSMKEIAERVGLASPETARSMKYKCLQKLRQLLGIIKN